MKKFAYAIAVLGIFSASSTAAFAASCVSVTSDGPNSNYSVTNCSSVTEVVVLGQPGEGPTMEYIQAGAEMPMGTTNKPYQYWACPSPQMPHDTRTGQFPQYGANSVQCK
jgi:hypothetical protein